MATLCTSTEFSSSKKARRFVKKLWMHEIVCGKRWKTGVKFVDAGGARFELAAISENSIPKMHSPERRQPRFAPPMVFRQSAIRS
jgi:hypothetical protein